MVRIITHPRFAFGRTVTIPEKIQLSPPGSRTPYDVNRRDGRLVGSIAPAQSKAFRAASDQIQLVLPWFVDLTPRARGREETTDQTRLHWGAPGGRLQALRGSECLSSDRCDGVETSPHQRSSQAGQRFPDWRSHPPEW
jgi:hypothetical protein